MIGTVRIHEYQEIKAPVPLALRIALQVRQIALPVLQGPIRTRRVLLRASPASLEPSLQRQVRVEFDFRIVDFQIVLA